MATGRTGERGAALLVVMVAVAVLTALAADLAYDTRVSLQIAANARDELRASYLARSGVALSRLVLSFQRDVDDAVPKLPGQNVSAPRPQLWRLVPVDSRLAGSLFGEPAPAAPPAGGAAGEAGAAASLVPPGGFQAVMDDEGRKVNANLDSLGTGLLGPHVQALFQLVCDPRWDAVFEREDENGLRVSRQDLLLYMKDWVDEDTVGSALVASFAPAGCVMDVPRNPFEPGFSDENFPYDRGEDRYRAKNARMDSLAELYLVAGVTDAFMAAFGDALTVHLPKDSKRNVNELDRSRLLELAKVAANPPNQPGLDDPAFAEQLQRAVTERTMGGILSLSPWEFGQILQGLKISVNQSQLTEASPQNPFTDRSTIYRVRATGRSGDVERTVEVVARFEKLTQGQVETTPGRLVHWREE